MKPRVAVFAGVTGRNLDRLVEYCVQIGVDRLNVSCSYVPGYNEEGYLRAESLRAFKKRFEDAGISIAVMDLGGVTPEMALGGEAGEKARSNLLATICSIGEAGIGVANLFTLIERREGDEEQWTGLVELYSDVARSAEEAGVRVGTHTHWLPRYILWDQAAFKRLLDAVGSESLGATYDPAISFLGGDDPYDVIRGYGRMIFFAHARDVKENGHSWCEQWESVRGRRYEDAFCGEGVIDYPRVIGLLIEAGYEGVIMPEHQPRVEGEQHGEVSIARAVGYLKGVLATR